MKWNSPSGALPSVGVEVFVVTKAGSTAKAHLGPDKEWVIYQTPIRYAAPLDEVSLWSEGVSSSGPGFQVPQDTLAEIIAIAINAERRAEIPNPSLLSIATNLRESLMSSVDVQIVQGVRKAEMPLFQNHQPSATKGNA